MLSVGLFVAAWPPKVVVVDALCSRRSRIAWLWQNRTAIRRPTFAALRLHLAPSTSTGGRVRWLSFVSLAPVTSLHRLARINKTNSISRQPQTGCQYLAGGGCGGKEYSRDQIALSLAHIKRVAVAHRRRRPNDLARLQSRHREPSTIVDRLESKPSRLRCEFRFVTHLR